MKELKFESFFLQINQAVIAYEISLIHAATVRDKNLKRIYKLGSNATA